MPSSIRAPPLSLMEMKGTFISMALSMARQMRMAWASPREPPPTVKSWEAAKASRPWI